MVINEVPIQGYLYVINYAEGEEEPPPSVFGQQPEHNAAGQRLRQQHQRAVTLKSDNYKQPQIDHNQRHHSRYGDPQGLLFRRAGFKQEQKQNQRVDHGPQHGNIS